MFSCRRCSAKFHNRHELYLHIREEHNQGVRGNQVTPYIDDPKVRRCYSKYKSFIHDDQSFYNFPLDHNFSLDDIDCHTNIKTNLILLNLTCLSALSSNIPKLTNCDILKHIVMTLFLTYQYLSPTIKISIKLDNN